MFEGHSADEDVAGLVECGDVLDTHIVDAARHLAAEGEDGAALVGET